LILHRVAGFVKHFIFSLKELQSLGQCDNVDRNGLDSGECSRPRRVASVLLPPRCDHSDDEGNGALVPFGVSAAMAGGGVQDYGWP
jgi:hypothetical protein